METATDRDVAKRLGYPATAGGYKAAREYLERRGVSPLDSRRPAIYHRDQVDRVLAEYPKAPGNFTTGPARSKQTSKAMATRASNRKRRQADQD
jgi:hypothetical protein